METRIHVLDLQTGLFVTELDRPWLDTPFLLQGFLIENQQQLEQLREYCEYVTVDLARSLGGSANWTSLWPIGVQSAPDAPDKPKSRRAGKQENPTARRISLLRQLRGLFASRGGASGHARATRRAAPDIIIYEDQTPVAQEVRQAQTVQQNALQFVNSLMATVRSDLQPKIEEVNEVVGELVDSIIRNPNALLWLTQLKDRDQYT